MDALYTFIYTLEISYNISYILNKFILNMIRQSLLSTVLVNLSMMLSRHDDHWTCTSHVACVYMYMYALLGSRNLQVEDINCWLD